MKKQVTEETKKILLDGGFEYEVKLMREAIAMYMERNLDLYLSAFLLHLRNLYEFFYGSKKDYYAHAGHYIKSWESRTATKEIKRWNTQINNFLSHLSYARVLEVYDYYPVTMLYIHYRGLVIDFLGELPEEYMTQKLKDLLESLKYEVEINKNMEKKEMRCVECKRIIDTKKDKWVGLTGDYWHTECIREEVRKEGLKQEVSDNSK